MFHTIKRAVVAAVLTSGIGIAIPAHASSYCHAPQYHLKTVTVYQNVRQPYACYVTKYDHCGHPYVARIVAWKTVRLPVQKTVRVAW